ncbi:MAG: hypothetical protein HRT61_04305 [Ekhidna sp.]|nr:hypothetical protein [Ekhidna sp.]
MKIEETWNTQKMRSLGELDLEATHQKKSINLVNKILDRLKLERTVTYIGGPILIAVTLYNHTYLYFSLVLLYFLGLVLYYNFLIRKIESVSIEGTVLEYLKHTLKSLRRFRTHYLILGVISFFLGLGLTTELFDLSLKIIYDPFWIVIFLIAIATSLLTFYFHYYPHLKRINQIVRELDNQPPNQY